MKGVQINIFQPDDKLKSFIYDYYFIHNQSLSHDKIPPLGFPVIKFHLKNNVKEFYANYNFENSDIMIVGQLTKYARLNQVENSSMIGVNFKPTALFKLTNIPVAYFTDRALSGSNILGKDAHALLNELQSDKPDEIKVSLLNLFFTKAFEHVKAPHDKFDLLVEHIVASKGNISVNTIREIMPVSDRTIQRYFNQRVGVSMKVFLRIIRHLNFFKSVAQNPEESLTSLIYQFGYYDFSHFAKDFRLLTNMTPTEYFSEKQEFAHLLARL